MPGNLLALGVYSLGQWISDLEMHSLVGGLQSGDYNLKRETTVWFLGQRISDPERTPNKQDGSSVAPDGSSVGRGWGRRGGGGGGGEVAEEEEEEEEEKTEEKEAR